ncbi:MAG: hypothetical protein HQ542_03960, partial [Bacteroidia bacterium]|nr:hypothetical protein [Bacteroidia bacterium]
MRSLTELSETIRSYSVIVTILVVGLVISLSLAEQPESFWPENEQIRSSSAIKGATGEELQLKGLFNVTTGLPIRVQGGFEEFAFHGTPSTGDVFSIIDQYHDMFGVSSENLEVLWSGQVLGKTSFTARQLIDGRPVLNTQVILRIGTTGKIIVWGSDIVPVQNLSWSAGITTSEAANSLKVHLTFEGKPAVLSFEEVWVREADKVNPAYRIHLLGDNPIDSYIGLIHAINGSILGITHRNFSGFLAGEVTGPVRPRNPNTDLEIRPISNQYVQIDDNTRTTTDADGRWKIPDLDEGEYELEMLLENDN